MGVKKIKQALIRQQFVHTHSLTHGYTQLTVGSQWLCMDSQ